MPDAATFHKAVVRYHGAHARSFPWRQTVDPYEVLIGEVLLQRTRGEHVVDVYREFLRRWPDPDALSAARLASIERVIRPLGFTKRAQVLKDLGRELAVLGSVPTEPDELLQLAGIGPYGAHAVPVFAQNRELPVVDWVIARVLRRYFGLSGARRPNADPELWDLAAGLAARGDARNLWLGVLDLGAAVCTRRPRCSVCPLEESCVSVKTLAT